MRDKRAALWHSSGMRILIVKLSSFGDLFHVLPLVHELKQQCAAHIDWLTQDAYTGLVGCFPDVDHVLEFPRYAPLRRLAWLQHLRNTRYDMILDCQGLLKSAVLARLARGERRIGPSFHREGSRLFYDEVAGACNKQRHAVDEHQDMLRHLGLNVPAPVFPVHFPSRTLTEPGPHIAITAHSRWSTKNWPEERFEALIERLLTHTGGTIYLPGDAATAAWSARVAARGAGRVVDLAGKTTMVEMGSLLQAMDLLVSVDSGPVHLAAAIGIPCVTVFGPTDARRTGPYGNRHRVLTAPIDCRPCFSRTCRRGCTACLQNVPVDEVLQAVLDLLAQKTDNDQDTKEGKG